MNTKEDLLDISKAKMILEALAIKRRSDYTNAETHYTEDTGMAYTKSVIIPSETSIFYAEEEELKQEFLRCIGLRS